MCYQDISIGNSPAQTDAQTHCIPGQGQGFLVVDEEIEGIVDKGRLDCVDCRGDVGGCDKRDFNGHLLVLGDGSCGLCARGWDRDDCETRINFGRYARLAAVIGLRTRWSGILSPCFDQAQSQSRISSRTYIC
jgi:hypothetical protein